MKLRSIVVAVLVVAALGTAYAAEVVIGLGHGQTVTSVAHRSLAEMADKILDRTGGEVEIQIFPANQLGNERDLAESLQQGILDMAWVSTAVMENFDSKMSMFSLPYVFKSYDHVADVVASDIGEYVFSSLLDSQGIRVLGFFDQGFRGIWNNARPLTNLEDFKGLKIRSPESPVYMGTFRLLDTNPTPMPWGEVYTSMQTNVVQGYECTPESVVANGMAEVTKFGSLVKHIYAGSVLMIRDDLWDELTGEQRGVITEEVAAAVAANRAMIIADEENYYKEMESKGMVLNSLPDAELDRLAKAVEPLYAEYADRLGSDDIIARAQAMYRK